MHRMTLRTGARDTKSVRTISLMERSCSKSARRISPILSTPIIPISPSQPTEAKGKDADTQRQRGSLLDAKIAPQGVIIASEFTGSEQRSITAGRGAGKMEPACWARSKDQFSFLVLFTSISFGRH